MGSIREYFSFFERRKRIMLVTFSLGFVLSVLLAYLMPPAYRSSATILIEGQQNTADPMNPMASGGGGASQRIKTLKQIVLSRERLANVIQSLDLFPEAQGAQIDDLVTMIRSKIYIKPIEASSGSGFGRPAASTIAFTLTFEGSDPDKTANVVQRLVTMFLAENLQSREGSAWVTYNFLKEQLSTLQHEIRDAEEKIAVFKDQHLHSLPEFISVNIQAVDNLQKDLEVRRIQLTAAKDRQLYLEGLLVTLDPSKQLFSADGNAVLTVEEKLKALRNQHLTMAARKSDRHPDVKALESQIAALEKVVDSGMRIRGLQQSLETKLREREMALKRYTAAHPDLKALDSQIAQLEADVAQGLENARKFGDQEKTPDNPAYVNTLTQVEAVKLEIQAVKSEMVRINAQLDEHKARLEETPKVEQDFIALKRKYDSLKEKYDETFERIQAARETLELEQQQIREKFTVIEPPSYPNKPFKPNRKALLALGVLFSAALAFGLGMAVEHLDHTVHSAGELQELTGHRVLGYVPYLNTAEEVDRQARRRKWAINAVGVVAALILVVIMIFVLRDTSTEQGVVKTPMDERTGAQIPLEPTK